MKILFWLPGGFWDKAIGGVESLAKTFATGLKKLGHEIYVISFESTYSAQDMFEHIDGIQLIRIGHAQLSKTEQLKSLKKLHTCLTQIQPDIFHLHYTANSNLIYYLFLTKYIQCPKVMTTHGLLCEEHFPIYQQIATKMEKIFCVSNALNQVSSQITQQQHITIYNGIDFPEKTYIAAKEFKHIRFLCLGRLTYEKGYDIAIKAFCKIHAQFKHIFLDIIGDGIEKDNLIHIAQKHQNIRFLGPLKHQDSLKHINKSHIILIPSRYESFGLVAVEAGIMGRTVIASQVGGLEEIITPQTGILVVPEDIDALAKAMIKLIQAPEQIEALGKQAHDWVSNNFSSEKMINAYLNHYQHIWNQTHDETYRKLLAERGTTPALESSFS